MAQSKTAHSDNGPVTLEALPDLPMRTLLRNVSLKQLICDIPLVSTGLSAMVPGVLATKRHLVLYIGERVHQSLICSRSRKLELPYEEELLDDKGQQLYSSFNRDVNRLIMKSISETAVGKLTTLMPGITALDIAIGQVDSVSDIFRQVARLLQHWAPQLKTLKLRCYLMGKHESTVKTEVAKISNAFLFRQLLEMNVNTLAALESLTVDFRERIGFGNEPLDMPILARLKHFHFNSLDHQSFLYFSLANYAETNTQLEVIGLGSPTTVSEFLYHFRYSNLAPKFTTFSGVLCHMGQVPSGEEQDQFLAAFPGLLSYHMHKKLLYGHSLEWMPQTLAPLTSLVHLEWHLDDAFILRDPPATIGQLTSIKVLTLYCATLPLPDFPHWGRLFPSVQAIVIENKDCSFQGLSKVERGEVLRPFWVQCPQLKKIGYFNRQLDVDDEFKREDFVF